MSIWERNWRASGIVFAVFFIIAYVMSGSQPKIGASAVELSSFYAGNSMRILMSSVTLGFAVLFLLWFAAALSGVIRDAGQGTWATAATASSAALGAIFWVLIALRAALAYSIVGAGSTQLASGLNDLSWALLVFSSLPAAMLVMGGSFGLWRAKIISGAAFAPGLAAVVLGVLGATTWAGAGIWAPDGAYTRFIWPLIFLAWVAVVSGFLSLRRPSPVSTPDRAAVSTATGSRASQPS
ncbi:MAG TPA: hypothetical protein VIY29_13350 [Ktedonobacteraceae bacterium]